MSMTSKVNLELRNAIISFLKPGTTATNNGLKAHVAPNFSTRAIQEATQKLAYEGVLVAERSKGKTWYGFVDPTTPPSKFIVEVEIRGKFRRSINLGLSRRFFPSHEAATAAMKKYGSLLSLRYRVTEVK